MLKIQCLTIDAEDPLRLAQFWSELLEVTSVVTEDDGSVWFEIPHAGHDILFLPSTDKRVVKNRLHLDLRPDDQAKYVDKALALGAQHINIGQEGTESWVVLADPEGNEFCILRAIPEALD